MLLDDLQFSLTTYVIRVCFGWLAIYCAAHSIRHILSFRKQVAEAKDGGVRPKFPLVQLLICTAAAFTCAAVILITH